MLILRDAVFLHVPKTGGTWVKAAMTAAGIHFEEHRVDDDIHGDLSYSPYPDRFTFAFVRHPLLLYQSYWRFKMTAGWDERNPFDQECRADVFDDFVVRTVERQPAWCSRMFEDYVGSRARPIGFIGRFERLMDDLCVGLRMAGESFDGDTIRRTPPVNVATLPSAAAAWRRDLAERVAVSEEECMARFGYRLDGALLLDAR